ncbi:MAG: calcium/sodium antiporter [Candidatus Izemoplasmataceae bacterium]
MLNWFFDLFTALPNWAEFMTNMFFLVIGMALLVKGADYFVDSASSLAKILGVSTLIIGLTIVSFGTSAPEASVSIFSQISGSSDISLGNIVGSNMFNSMVVLGSSAIFAPIVVHYSLVKREIPFMVMVTAVLFGFAVFFGINGNYVLLQIEGVILLVLFVWYLGINFKVAKSGKEVILDIDDDIDIMPAKKSILFLLIGLAMIIVGGEMVVSSARNSALMLGVSEALVGLTIVALGTSLPELVTSVVAARKNENDIALGNVIGSNIFNILLVLGIGASIGGMIIQPVVIFDLLILLGFTFFLTWTIVVNKKITKGYGYLYLALYVIYIAYIIFREVL